MTVPQSSSDEWNWCIATCRVFETRIFVSSNFKKMRKCRFSWWSSFVYLFLIEVLNDFGLLKRIYVFWSKRDPVGDWNWCIPSYDTLNTPCCFVSNDTFSSMVDRLHVRPVARVPLSSISRWVDLPEIALVHFVVGLRPHAIIPMKTLFFYAAKLNKFVFLRKLKESQNLHYAWIVESFSWFSVGVRRFIWCYCLLLMNNERFLLFFHIC